MNMTQTERLDKLLDAYSHQYDVDRVGELGGGVFPATATYYLRDENYLISKSHVLSAVENHDYVYFSLNEHLNAAAMQRLIDKSLQLGKQRVKPHKEHMSSFVTLVILADSIDEEAKKLLKRTRFRKYFRLALHGWMEYHITAMEISTMSFLSNPAGRDARKTLELNFSPRAKKKGEYK